MIKEIVRNSECDHPPKTPFLKWNCNIDDDLERMICMMERHFPFPYAALQIYATRGCNAENSTFNMKRNFEKDLFFSTGGQSSGLVNFESGFTSQFAPFPSSQSAQWKILCNLFVCRFVGVWDRERERERVDPRRKLLIALVVLNCLQPLPKLSGEINIEKHYKIIFKKIQQHLRSADDRSWKDGIHGSDCSLKMSLYSI